MSTACPFFLSQALLDDELSTWSNSEASSQWIFQNISMLGINEGKKKTQSELNLSHFSSMFWCHLHNGFSRWSRYDVVTSILKVGAPMLSLLKG